MLTRAIFVTKTKTKTITNKNEKSGANHTARLQPYCANLSWHSNANITWLLVFGLENSE